MNEIVYYYYYFFNGGKMKLFNKFPSVNFDTMWRKNNSLLIIIIIIIIVHNGDKWQPPLKVYQMCKWVGFKAQALIWHSLDDNGLSWDLI